MFEKIEQIKEQQQANLEFTVDKKTLKEEKTKAFKEAKAAELERKEYEINRNMNKTIIKNKGITRKRPKKDRNPRVKKRIQYEKAVKKRNTMVKSYKDGPQGLYQGEMGVQSGLVKSIRM